MDKLFDANNIDTQRITISQLEQTPATVAFLGGELDAIVFASAPESLMVQMLLQTPGVKLMDFAQSEAYSRRFPFLTPVVLPRGVVDLARDLPPADLRLVATTTSLLARARDAPGAAAAVRAGGARPARPGRLVQPRRRLPDAGPQRVPDLARGRARDQGRPALPAALPAVLAGQPGRAHVAGAGHHHRHPAAAVAHRAAAVPVPHPLARVPLVRPAARDRAADGQPKARTPAKLTPELDALEQRAAASACRCRTPTSSTRCATTSSWCGRTCSRLGAEWRDPASTFL